MQQETQRQLDLERIRNLLNTPDGLTFVNELAEVWDLPDLMAATPEQTAYNVGVHAAFKFILQLQNGELIHE